MLCLHEEGDGDIAAFVQRPDSKDCCDHAPTTEPVHVLEAEDCVDLLVNPDRPVQTAWSVLSLLPLPRITAWSRPVDPTRVLPETQDPAGPALDRPPSALTRMVKSTLLRL